MCGSRECLVSYVFFPLLHVNGPRATIYSNLAVREYTALEKANWFNLFSWWPLISSCLRHPWAWAGIKIWLSLILAPLLCPYANNIFKFIFQVWCWVKKCNPFTRHWNCQTPWSRLWKDKEHRPSWLYCGQNSQLHHDAATLFTSYTPGMGCGQRIKK